MISNDNLPKNQDNLKHILLSTLFIIGISLGLLIWNKIALPYHNPWGIVGKLTEIQYNPLNDSIRFVVFILFPVLILSVIYLLNIKNFNNICFTKDTKNFNGNMSPDLSSRSAIILAGILILYSTLAAINIPTTRASGEFDAFHEGTTLGLSVSQKAGKVPYKDFVLFHGVYEGSLRSVLAFRLFGKSIGSFRTLESIVKILLFASISIFLMLIYRGNYLYSFATFLILVLLCFPPPTLNIKEFMILKGRDITTFLFLITIPLLHNFISHNRLDRVTRIDATKLFVTAFFFSFIPLASFGYSSDRGVYLSATYLIILPLLYFFFFHKSPYRTHFITSSFLGLLSALLLMGSLLREGVTEFFTFTFSIMPRYRELMFGDVYPIYSKRFLVSCVLVAGNTYWVTMKFIQELHLNDKKVKISIRKFLEKYLIEFCLLIVSVFLFRNALGRSDWFHLAYTMPVIYLLSIYIIIKYYLYNILHRYGLEKKFAYALVFIIMFSSIAGVYRIYNRNLLIENFPYKIDDAEFIPDSYKATISFLKTNLSQNDEFYTMTNDSSWYYFIDKPPPTRFPQALYAIPFFYQKEVIQDLKKSNVKFIIYRSDKWSNRINGFNNEARLPIIYKYLAEDYVFFKKIDDNEIWIRKPTLRHN